MVNTNVSTSVADDIIKSTIEVINEFVTTCNSIQTNDFRVDGTNCNIRIENTTISQVTAYDGQCIANLQANNDLDQKIRDVIKQKTEAAAAALNLNLSTAVATSIIKSITDLSEKVKNTYINTCAITQNNVQSYKCDGGTLTITGVNFNQSATIESSCVFQNKAVTQAKIDLEKLIDQETSSSTSFFSTGVIIAIIVIVVIIIILIIISVVYSNSSG